MAVEAPEWVFSACIKMLRERVLSASSKSPRGAMKGYNCSSWAASFDSSIRWIVIL
jgi:hypothetical protein